MFGAALDAAVVLDLHKLIFRASDDWSAIADLVVEVGAYPEGIGFAAKRAVMECLDSLAARTRSRMPADVSYRISRVALETAELYSLNTTASKELTLLREMSGGIGSALVYDGSLYLQDLKVVESGADILWHLLSLAVRLQDSRLRTTALRGFAAGLDGSSRGGQPDSEGLLTVYRAHGLTGSIDSPTLPRELALKL